MTGIQKTKVEDTKSKQMTKMSGSIPMDWTNVKRTKSSKKRRFSKSCVSTSFSSTSTESQGIENCCSDSVCWDHVNSKILQNDQNNLILKGEAIFCLHEMDSNWFQGHFFPVSATHNEISDALTAKPIGLLATQNTKIDDCLQCADGGYKELEMNMTQFANKSSQLKESHNYPTSIRIPDLVCTGGDMMRIFSRDIDFRKGKNDNFNPLNSDDQKKTQKNQKQSPSNETVFSGKDMVLEFNTKKLVLGQKTLPYLYTYFRPIVNQVLQKTNHKINEVIDTNVCDDPKSKEILSLLPDCAIVLGSMEVHVSKNDVTKARELEHIYHWFAGSEKLNSIFNKRIKRSEKNMKRVKAIIELDKEF